MRIGKSLALGVAGSVLMAGSALAADPVPVVVTTVPTVVVTTPGREVVIDVTARAGFFYEVGDPSDLWAVIDGVVEVTSPGGWGVRLDGGNYTQFLPGFGGEAFGTITAYRAFGDLELGVWLGGGLGYPSFGYAFATGLSAIYEHEGPRLYVRSENRFVLWPTMGFSSSNEIEFDLTDRLTLSSYLDINPGSWFGGVGVDVDVTERIEVWGNLYYGYTGIYDLDVGAEVKITDRISLWTEAGFEFDAAPFDYLDFGMTFELSDALAIKSVLSFDDGPFEFDYAALWAELDRPIGTGPLSLIGELGVEFDGDFEVWGNIGIRYKLGGPEDRDDNRLFVNDPF